MGGIPLHRRSVELSQLAKYLIELALRLHEAEYRRSRKVGE